MEKKQIILRKLAVVLLVSILFYACHSNNEAVFKVNIKGFGGQSAIFQEQRVAGVRILDTVAFNSRGKLTYRASLRQPMFYNLNIPNSSDIFFLVFPGDKIYVTATNDGKIEDLNIKGSEESVKLNYLYDSLFVTRNVLKNIRKKYKKTEDPSIRDSLNKKYEKILDSYRKFSMQFVLDNLHSLCSIAALYQEVGPSEFVFGRKRDLQFFKLATDSLTKYYPRHRHVQALNRNFKTMMESVKLEDILSKVGGTKHDLPFLELPSINGKLTSLTDVGQRYVLLNFYNESVREISDIFPKLNQVYNKYSKNGFDIYNVYLGKSPENWEKIVHFEEIDNWINVADTSFPLSQTRASYNVQSLPSNYLLDLKEKVILLRDISPERLNQILANLVYNK
jgi:hypothetical protein